ncbi:MAG: hypothetical protein P4L56_11050 [Candidatus Sulfopaludibacter sp.]|nr:hypothetical protein [Candidatus Sulfopaludibacter sp.]
MSTRKQRRDNRRNTQLTTGPAAGPERNLSPVTPPLQSGLDAQSQSVPGESPEEFARLQSEYVARFAPTTPEQRFQMDCLIRNEWLLRRLFRVEAQLWEYYATQAGPSSGLPLGEAFSHASPIFMRLRRQISAAEKAYKEAKAELERLQEAAQPPQSTTEAEELASFRAPREWDRPIPPAPPPDPALIQDFQASIP